MNTIRSALFLTLIAVSVSALSYETDTHARITSHAFERSVLATSQLANRLGLERYDDELAADDGDPAQPFLIPDYIAYSEERSAYLDFRQVNWDGAFSTSSRRTPQLFDSINMYSGPGEDYRGRVSENGQEGRFGLDHLRTKAWLMRGAIREDDITALGYFVSGTEPPYPDVDPYGAITRVTRHFYDPIHDAPLDSFVGCTLEDCERSPEWAFGQPQVAGAAPQPPDPNRRNHFTWADAREAQWCALTRNEGLPTPFNNADRLAGDRRLCWATTIKALGHVLHLLQDLAQPQHVRNDNHAPLITTPARQSFEQWTNFRAAGEASGTVPGPDGLSFIAMIGSNPNTPLVTGLTYPIPSFARPVHYFTTRQVETGTTPAELLTRRGLADFTNRSFFSEGTILSTRYSLPPSDQQSPSFESVDRVMAADPAAGQLTERLLLSPLVDAVQGGYVDGGLTAFNGKVPVANLGLWADFATGTNTEIYQSLSLFTQTTQADVLIPRAIAYSAGLIDYFFRGKLEVTPPLDGLFSVIDHATPHTVGAAGLPVMTNGNVYGFTRVRMRVRNDTAAMNESGITPAATVPRNMAATSVPVADGAPMLMAVARYHRNPCYRPDLSGERRVDFAGVVTEPSGCTAGTRTPFQELSVSRAVATDATQINGPGQDLVFDFSQQPIPVNATDLVIQVVYRGPLGLESDAIAVSSFDVLEPTYITLWNNTDYAGCFGNWAAQGSTPAGCIVEGAGAQRNILTTRICIGTQLVFQHFESPHGILALGGYVRLAALLDGQVRATRSRSIVQNINSAVEIRNRSITGDVRQSNKEDPTAQAPYTSQPLWQKRGIVGSFRPLPYYQINGTDPQPINDMGPLDVGALANAISVPVAPDAGNVLFPELAASDMTCTVAGTQPMFADEMAHVRR